MLINRETYKDVYQIIDVTSLSYGYSLIEISTETLTDLSQNNLANNIGDLINVENSEVEPGEQPVVQSRYSIVIAAAKRARQIINGSEVLCEKSLAISLYPLQ